jgi:uncharacterized peroxidase-related enzyme
VESDNEDQTKHLKHDWREAGLSKGDEAVCAWAEKLTLNLASAGAADVAGLRAVGFSEEAISDAAQVIGYFNYINRIAEGLGVDLENGMSARK